MKLRKSKLAAILLSGLMVVSAMSPYVYADDEDEDTTGSSTEEVVEDTDDSSDDSNTGDVTLESVEYSDFYFYIDEDVTDPQVRYKITYNYSDDSETDNYWYEDATLTTVAATCTTDGSVTAKLTIDPASVTDEETDAFKITSTGVSYTVTIDALGHDPVAVNYLTTVPATCETEGTSEVTYYCSRCGAELYTKEETVPALGHDFDWDGSFEYYAEADSNIKISTSSSITVEVYEDGEATEETVTLYKATLSDGAVQLSDSSKSGTYYMVYTCSRDDDHLAAVKGTKSSTAATYIKILDSTGIATELDTNYEYSTSKTDLPATADIELKDCTVAGSYTIGYYDADDNFLGSEIIPVPAHHMEVKVAVFSSYSDMALCDVTTNSAGELVVTNKSCYLTVTYIEQVECTAAGCPNADCTAKYEKDASGTVTVNYLENYNVCENTVVEQTTKTAEPSADHTVLAAAKNAIAAAIKEAEAASEDFTYEDLEEVLTGSVTVGSTTYKYSDYVKLSDDPSDCTTGGEVTVTYICTVDKVNVAATETVTVDPKGHDFKDVVVNYVDATCEADGSYDVVNQCVRDGCGYINPDVETVHYTIDRLAHTNELSDDGIHPYYCNSDGTANDYTDENEATVVYIEFVGTTVVGRDGNPVINDDNTGYVRVGGTSDNTLAVYVKAYTLCETCGGHKVNLNNPTSGYVSVTATEVVAQGTDGTGGYITLSAKYVYDDTTKSSVTVSKTFAYYTSALAYAARIEDNTTGTDSEEVVDPDADVKNGLAKDEDGVVKYFKADEFDETFTGITDYDGGYFLVVDGLIATEVNGLWQDEDAGVWYYLALGQVQTQYTGLVQYDGCWFYVTNGVLDTTKIGLVEYDGETFLVSDGKLRLDYSGLWLNSSTIGGDDQWYFIGAGMVQAVSQVVEYDGEFFVVVDGILDTTYTGTILYDGVYFYVVAGQLYGQVA